MNSHVIVYGSWFAFAIIAYLIIINLFGFIWAFRINSKNRSISIPLVTINAVLGVFSFAINIMIIVLYALYGKNYLEMQNTVQKSIQTLYHLCICVWGHFYVRLNGLRHYVFEQLFDYFYWW